MPDQPHADTAHGDKLYVPWKYASGPNQCAHGWAKGIDCPHCDKACACHSADSSSRAGSTVDLLSTTDTVVWAREFVRIYQEKGIGDDPEGWMIGWFANAIQVGRWAGEADLAQARARLALLEGVVEAARADAEFDDIGCECRTHKALAALDAAQAESQSGATA